jgi:lipoprotein-anchoring transpeptidase ErfK/SrfK
LFSAFYRWLRGCFINAVSRQNPTRDEAIKMKRARDKRNELRQTLPLSGASILAALLFLTNVSAALQTSAPAPSLPKTPEFAKNTVRWVLVSIPDRKLALFENGKVVRIYRVAVGKASAPSPVGEFKILNRVSNPTYYHKGQVIGAGKSNPVGSRWMGLSAKGYGIHGTNQPNSIGKAASTGCIRMGKRDLEELFAIVNAGDAVEIRAERDDEIAAVFGSTPDPGTETTIETLAQVETGDNADSGQ